jgi:hypothetical protein
VEARPVVDNERRRAITSSARTRPRGDAQQYPIRRGLDSFEALELDGRGVGHDAADCRSVICPARMGSDAVRR